MRFLCLSDIHGHADALRAVLAEAETWGFDQLIVCGDHLFPGPEPLGVWKLLVQHHAVCIRGLGDQALVELDPSELVATTEIEQKRLERLSAVHEELGELIVAHLGRLPPIARLPLESGHEMVVVHGSPADFTEPLTPDLSDEEMLGLLGSETADLIICGGDHVPFQRQIDEVRIVGVGSVGESPDGMFCHATLVTSTGTQTSIEQREVPFPGRS
jgi:predicted phosphodiesterase